MLLLNMVYEIALEEVRLMWLSRSFVICIFCDLDKILVQSGGGDVNSLSTRCPWNSLALSASPKDTVTTSIIGNEAVVKQLG